MSKTMQYLLFCWLLVVVVASSNPTRTGYPRSNRGFKSQGLSTARGFGKRDPGLNLGHGVFMGGNPPPGSLNGQQQQQVSVESLLPPNIDVRA
jgi:hypothetical protein